MKKREPKNLTDNMVAVLRDGKDGAFWNTIKKILQNEKEDINEDIFKKEELGLTDSQVNDLIKWHNFLDYVVKLPEKCIESLETVPVKDEEGYDGDPYDKVPLQDVRERIKSR